MQRVLAALAVTLMLMLGFGAPAQANETWNYASYEQQVTISKNGVATVVLDAAFDYGNSPGHGPLLTFITKQKMADGRWRLLPTEVLSVTSSTGANTDMQVTETYSTLTLRVGRQGTRYTGVERYTITYRVGGMVTPNHPESKLDEFNWNNIGTAGNMDHNNIKVTITGPDAPTQGACYYGRDYRKQCTSSTTDNAVILTLDHLDKSEGMQVVAGYPIGTFVDAEPRYETPPPPPNPLPLDPIDIGAAGLIGAAGVGAATLLGRRRRDLAYAGVTPGDRPLDMANPAVMYRDPKAPIAVRFSPPTGVRPAEGHYLLQKGNRAAQTSATLIDLAVRGYLTIEADGKKDYIFHRTEQPMHAGNPDLTNYERALLNGVFDGRPTSSTKRIRKRQKPIDARMKSQLARRVTEFGWFDRNPSRSFELSAGLGIAVVVGGVLLGFNLLVEREMGWAALAIGVIVVAILMQLRRVSRRTAEGSMALAQVEGFKKYIETAEADQLEWEEGQDIFSAHLPWAIAFGEAERWTKIFQQLAEAGRYTYQPTWYYSPYGGYWYGGGWSNIGNIGSAIESSVRASEAAASAGTSSASSGFSGFSGGGGGFGGGGSGGW